MNGTRSTPRSRSTAFGGVSDLWKCGKPKASDRKVVGWKQLCAITKDQYQPLGGWKDAVMTRVVRLGYATPEPERVRKAMDAVDYYHRLSALPKPKPVRVVELYVRPISAHEARSILAGLFARVSA